MDKKNLEDIKIVQRDAAYLASGYLKGFRRIEIASVITFLTLSAMIFTKLSFFEEANPLLFIIAFFLGWIGADFVSGLVHWMGDTWGDADWPIIGKTLIRTFREHHVDQEAITRHDFIETNGSNCMVSLPVLFGALFLPLEPGNSFRYFLVSFFLCLTLWVFATNQIHKWAHKKEGLSKLILFFQKTRLILSPEHHSIHHKAPYSKYYCITTGWLNMPLTRIGFFPRFEKLITKLTGAIPRKDDIGKEAAQQIIE